MSGRRVLELGAVGPWSIKVVSGGRFRADGGAMFGVVPKGMWSRLISADEDNLIAQQTNCLLLQSSDRVVLVDTGYGGKLSEKQRRWMRAEEGDPLLVSLSEAGVQPEDVTDVVFSHLHYDHCGGASVCVAATSADGESLQAAVPAFPLATHYVQQREWELAHDRSPELRGVYPQVNIEALEDVSWERAQGEAEILPGVHVLPSPGHTAGHQCIVIRDERRVVAYLGDMTPTTHHFPTLWCTAYDVELLETRRSKMKILAQAAAEQWTVVLSHDSICPAAAVRQDDYKGFALDGQELLWEQGAP